MEELEKILLEMIKNIELKSEIHHNYDPYKDEWTDDKYYYDPYQSGFTVKSFAIQGHIFNKLIPIINKVLKENNLENED